MGECEKIFAEANAQTNFKAPNYQGIHRVFMEKIRYAAQLSADNFDPVNGFRGGPVGTCGNSDPAFHLQMKIYALLGKLRAKYAKKISLRSEPSGTLAVSMMSMYATNNFMETVNTKMNGDPDMPYDLTGAIARYEIVPATLPSWMTTSGNPGTILNDIYINTFSFDANGDIIPWGGVPADFFHYLGISTILNTGISLHTIGYLCDEPLTSFGYIVGSSSGPPPTSVTAHEMTHGIGINHTNTPDDIANNEIMRPAVNILSNYWNVANTITPFWQIVNASTDCIDAAAALPVELIDFTARLEKNKTVKLEWYTANEKSNKGFDVQKMNAANNWESIGWLDAAQKHTYELTDAYPLSINYYRLLQVDLDGKQTLSKVVSVAKKGSDALTVYPNPTNGKIRLESNLNLQNAEVRIFNSLGQVVLSGKGLEMDMFILANGIYEMTVSSGERILRTRILKQ